MTDQLIFIDGQWVPKENAKLSVFDHGVLYGDGVFEGMRAYNRKVFRLKEHMERLYQSADLISLKIPMSQAELIIKVNESIQKNSFNDAYIRLLITRGTGDLGLDPRACPHPSIVIITDKLALFPAECYEKGLQAVVAKTKRNLVEAINPVIKSMNYLNSILAKIEANKNGVPEAIMLNVNGYVAECTGDNVFFIKNNMVVTPPVSAGVLVGITRRAVMQLINKSKDLKMKEKLFKPDELYSADEVFFTGTAAEIIPVTKIDDKPIGNGKPGVMTTQLMGAFKGLVQTEN